MNPSELRQLRHIFRGEKYIIVIGKNLKKKLLSFKGPSKKADVCHIVLHEDATNEDIVKSTFNLAILRQILDERIQKIEEWNDNIRTEDCYDVLELSKIECDTRYKDYKEKLGNGNDWQTEFLFGRCSKRSVWPLVRPVTNHSSLKAL